MAISKNDELQALANSMDIAQKPDERSPEMDALGTAYAHLIERNVAAAEALLAPFEAVTTHPVTLSVIARMRMVQGAFDSAHALLARAEALDPFDRGVWETLADLLAVQRRHVEEVVYRRKLAYTDPHPPARAYLGLVRAFVAAAQGGGAVPIGELRLASRKIAEAPELNALLRVQFAESLYPVKKMVDEAKAHYAAARPCPAGAHDVSARWVDLAGWCEQSGQVLHRSDEAADGQVSLVMAELKDVQLFPSFQWIPVLDGGQAILKGFALSRLRSQREQEFSPLLLNNSRTAELRMPRQLPVVDTPALLVGSTPQYYHHTIDFASRLAVVEAMGVGRDLPIVVNDDLAPFQLEHFALLGYPLERLIRVKHDQPVCFRELIVPGVLTTGGRWMSPLIPDWYRSRLATVPARTSRLYLSRRLQARRRVVNEDALSRMLESLGFQIVCPEQLSVREQIDLFASASHIVSPTGAALTNMVYAPPGAQVVLLQTQYLALAGGDHYFDALALACGHRYSVVVGGVSEGRAGGRAFDADFVVDIEAVRAPR